ncbi:MAG: winged helix-turn-helix domain-containing protein [Chloroflexota bacterium]
MIHLLLVDGDDTHRHELAARLRRDGFAVAGAAGASDALELARRCWPHLVLADLAFADGSAARLAADLNRHGDVSFVVVSTNADSAVRVDALTCFADDFVLRPYCYDELVARVRRVLQRTLVAGRLGTEPIALGEDRRVDLRLREIRDGDRVIRLTPTEARLLGLFLVNAGQVLPTDLILQRVWPDAGASANTLWEYVRRLRAKLGDDGRMPRYITSTRGIGYRFARLAIAERRE